MRMSVRSRWSGSRAMISRASRPLGAVNTSQSSSSRASRTKETTIASSSTTRTRCLADAFMAFSVHWFEGCAHLVENIAQLVQVERLTQAIGGPGRRRLIGQMVGEGVSHDKSHLRLLGRDFAIDFVAAF